MGIDESRREAWKDMQSANQYRPIEPELPLQGGGGGGTYDGMVPIKEYVDKADEAVESRLMARMDTLATKADISASQSSTRANIWGVGGALFLGIIAVLGYASDRFDGGIGMADKRQAQLQVDAKQDAAAKEQSRQFQEILKRLPPPKG